MNRERTIWCTDLGYAEFSKVHKLQLALVDARVTGKLDRDILLVVEHPPVFTMGRRGGRDHLKISDAALKASGVNIHHIERGGDITFHGPGQLVAYPIIHLKQSGYGVVEFVEKLEEIMIRTAAGQGVTASRDTRNHGVWSAGKKLGFVGIAVRRSVTYHGIALNVQPSLAFFDWINPCGMQDVHITSMDKESRQPVRVHDVKPSLLRNCEDVLDITLQSINHDNLKGLLY